jgi:hypothetical protein
MIRLLSFYNREVECQVGGVHPVLFIKNGIYTDTGQPISDTEAFWLEKTYEALIFEHWWANGGARLARNSERVAV